MEFNITEKNGSIPIDNWLAEKIREHAKNKFGIELDIKIKSVNKDVPKEKGSTT